MNIDIVDLIIKRLISKETLHPEGEKPGHSKPAGTCIVVLERGYIYVGDLSWQGNWGKLIQCRNIRRWGTTKGLGELVTGPTADTKLDFVGVLHFPESAVILIIPVSPVATWE